ncbi:hypothetical protein R3O55_012740 [Bacteroides hominis]|uniref:hypothetical protein n=1 Tax=Bacteroides hominis TaxID=2763023 RepID=UPI0029490A51|nr:hypothetical protein [Bacteroides hominis (ex Liu et al. 2022)]MDV6135766.1 hypothetical protein [Bacteroides hominis (ex Liu et al. 2022)]MDV6153125.1 hypothetical protein [Bacteroides hominis (ex Liu et al. 2022)]
MKKFTFALFASMPMALLAQAPALDSSSNGFGSVLIVLLICIIIFIVCRELLCWYYKINKMVSNQEEIIRLLKKIAHENDAPTNNTKLGEEKKGVLKELANSTKFMVTRK